MPIAKETLRIGFTVAAVEGGYVTKEAVAKYGWADKVTDGPDVNVSGDKSPSRKPAKAGE